MIRGLAAVMVLFFHVRYRFFLDYADLSEPTLLTRAWYVATAFGHDAVMVFFVVSGFLVGSGTLNACRTGRWNWPNYITARTVRLYVVLVPGLLLTLLWDQLGLQFFHDELVPRVKARLSALTGGAWQLVHGDQHAMAFVEILRPFGGGT
jgi:peptidoglycan/LPS O-acetylase OafA/YrhL